MVARKLSATFAGKQLKMSKKVTTHANTPTKTATTTVAKIALKAPERKSSQKVLPAALETISSLGRNLGKDRPIKEA